MWGCRWCGGAGGAPLNLITVFENSVKRPGGYIKTAKKQSFLRFREIEKFPSKKTSEKTDFSSFSRSFLRFQRLYITPCIPQVKNMECSNETFVTKI